jgi:hypothetical protein
MIVPTFSRRSFHRLAAGNSLALGLAHFLHGTVTADDQGMESLNRWFQDYRKLGDQLARGDIKQDAWQDEMTRLFKSVSIPSLMQRIDYERLADKISSSDLGKRGEVFHTLMVSGDSREAGSGPEPRRALITKLAYIKKGRSVPPHGHSNMVSAFLNLSGEFHVRQYDKLADQDDALVIRATDDSVCGAGTWSSISDVRNNVHWITAKSDDCFMFTTKMIELTDDKPFHGRMNIDVLRARDLGSGRLSAHKITAAQAGELY